jgi:hypothetical protein
VSFARFVLETLPALGQRLDRKEVTDWLAAQDSVEVDGERMWISGGDRLLDEAEMKLDWARAHGLVDEAEIQRLQGQYRSNDSDTVAIDVD